MKALIIDNVQDDAEARQRLREALCQHFPAEPFLAQGGKGADLGPELGIGWS